MHRLICSAVAGLGLMASAANAAGPTWASGVVNYDSGSGITLQVHPNAALNAPAHIMGLGSAWPPSLLTPFSPQFDADQIVGIGQGGSLTLEFPKAIAVTGTPQIGVITSAGLSEASWGAGVTSDPADTFASMEYGAQRSARVEVADGSGDFKPIGRIVFENPANYYRNITELFPAAPPADPVLANFGKPFTGNLADFSNKDLAGVLAVLGESAGGQWLTVPASLGLSEIRFIRFSEPLWMLPDGSTRISAASVYGGELKPADLFIDAVVAVPEPAGAALLLLAGAAMLRRRA